MSVNFRLPGPTPLPPEVIAALGRPMIPHRGPVFRELYTETLRLAREIHRTDGDVLTWAATGSAGWEAAIVNVLSPGDRVLATINGDFGERFARVATRMGLEVVRLEAPWGEPVLPGQLREALSAEENFKAVLLVHNETSTGVTNPLQELAAVVRDYGALAIVDAVSGVGALPLEMDEWGVDVVMSGSQKAWMCPPGLLIVAIGGRAWSAHEHSTFPRFYWDFSEAKAMADQGMTPTTPPLSLLFAFRAALGMMADEGVENVWARHHRLGSLTRTGLRAAGLKLLAREGFESDSVTAFLPPEGVSANDLLALLRSDYGVEAQGGQAHLKDALVRIGHMGWAQEPELREAVQAIVDATSRLSRAADSASEAREQPASLTA